MDYKYSTQFSDTKDVKNSPPAVTADNKYKPLSRDEFLKVVAEPCKQLFTYSEAVIDGKLESKITFNNRNNIVMFPYDLIDSTFSASMGEQRYVDIPDNEYPVIPFGWKQPSVPLLDYKAELRKVNSLIFIDDLRDPIPLIFKLSKSKFIYCGFISGNITRVYYPEAPRIFKLDFPEFSDSDIVSTFTSDNKKYLREKYHASIRNINKRLSYIMQGIALHNIVAEKVVDQIVPLPLDFDPTLADGNYVVNGLIKMYRGGALQFTSRQIITNNQQYNFDTIYRNGEKQQSTLELIEVKDDIVIQASRYKDRLLDGAIYRKVGTSIFNLTAEKGSIDGPFNILQESNIGIIETQGTLIAPKNISTSFLKVQMNTPFDIIALFDTQYFNRITSGKNSEYIRKPNGIKWPLSIYNTTPNGILSGLHYQYAYNLYDISYLTSIKSLGEITNDEVGRILLIQYYIDGVEYSKNDYQALQSKIGEVITVKDVSKLTFSYL